MKKWIWAFILGTMVTSSALYAEDVFRIEVGRREGSVDRELIHRVYALERAVDQLQRKIYDLETRNNNENNNKAVKTTCYIKTPFNGTFTSTEATETLARAKTLKKCTDSANEIYCMERDIKCGQ